MTHRFRYWKSYPATPTPIERRRGNRVVSVALAVGLILCAVSICVLFAFVLDLKASRDREVNDRTRAINEAMCSVLQEFHYDSPDLTKVRVNLHCPPPTGA